MVFDGLHCFPKFLRHFGGGGAEFDVAVVVEADVDAFQILVGLGVVLFYPFEFVLELGGVDAFEVVVEGGDCDWVVGGRELIVGVGETPRQYRYAAVAACIGLEENKILVAFVHLVAFYVCNVKTI